MNIKKIALVFVFLGAFQFSFAQDYKSSTESVKNIDTQIRNGSFGKENATTDKLIFKVKENHSQDTAIQSDKINDEEWLDIKREMEINKRKVSTNKNYIHTEKVIDTVFVTVPILGNESQLSGW